MSELPSSVEEIFHSALELKNPGLRNAFLDVACADAKTRRRVEDLLSVQPKADRFFAQIGWLND